MITTVKPLNCILRGNDTTYLIRVGYGQKHHWKVSRLVFYYQMKISINFWYGQWLNLKFLIQL